MFSLMIFFCEISFFVENVMVCIIFNDFPRFFFTFHQNFYIREIEKSKNHQTSFKNIMK